MLNLSVSWDSAALRVSCLLPVLLQSSVSCVVALLLLIFPRIFSLALHEPYSSTQHLRCLNSFGNPVSCSLTSVRHPSLVSSSPPLSSILSHLLQPRNSTNIIYSFCCCGRVQPREELP